MNRAVDQFFELRLAKCRMALLKNNFEVHDAVDASQARTIILEEIIPQTNAKSVSYGGSLSVEATGVLDVIRSRKDLELHDVFRGDATSEEKMEKCRRALLVDLFLTGTNAITMDGKLVNLDMWGNRVGALAFGPRNVVVVSGRNKLVANIEEAMARTRNLAAPLNAIRIDLSYPRPTPCTATGECTDCSGEWRICNTWVISEKSFPKHRIKVILVNEDLGL